MKSMRMGRKADRLRILDNTEDESRNSAVQFDDPVET
jgi:hypothetical protein